MLHLSKLNDETIKEVTAKAAEEIFDVAPDLEKVILKVRTGVPYKGMFHPVSKGKSEIYINPNHKDVIDTIKHELVHFYLHDIKKDPKYKDGDLVFKKMVTQALDPNADKIITQTVEDTKKVVKTTTKDAPTTMKSDTK